VPELKPFSWKMQQFKLPTRDMLIHRGCSMVEDCGWCNGIVEILEHLLCTCSVSSTVWSWIGADIDTKNSFISVQDLLAHIKN